MSTRIKTRKGWVPVAGSYISIEHDCTIPVGVIVSYYGTVAPDGWFICNGTDTTGTENELAVKYPKLYKVLGNSNVLPDLIGATTHDEQKGVNFIIKAAECIDVSGAGTSADAGTGTNTVVPVPDWANSVNVNISSASSSDQDTLFTYTAPGDGYISFLSIVPQYNEIINNQETIAINIQDRLVYQQHDTADTISIPAIPVSKDDIIKLTGFSSTNNKQKLVFTPYKQR